MGKQTTRKLSMPHDLSMLQKKHQYEGHSMEMRQLHHRFVTCANLKSCSLHFNNTKKYGMTSQNAIVSGQQTTRNLPMQHDLSMMQIQSLTRPVHGDEAAIVILWLANFNSFSLIPAYQEIWDDLPERKCFDEENSTKAAFHSHGTSNVKIELAGAQIQRKTRERSPFSPVYAHLVGSDVGCKCRISFFDL
jgi:hypothetical protein